MEYGVFLEKLRSLSEEDFADFQRRLIFTKRTILGVRTPLMRALAKECVSEIETLLSFPNEYYEVCFIKLTAVSLLPYEKFLQFFDQVVPLIDNWALCDGFRPKCIATHKQEFLPHIERYFASKEEFSVRFAIVSLLAFYVQTEYFSLLSDYLKRTDTRPYYVHMAAAWLMAELIIKDFTFGVNLLKEGVFDVKTHNKAIQKARESFRLTKEQKEQLFALKIK